MKTILIPFMYSTGITAATAIFTRCTKNIFFYIAIFSLIFSITYWIENTSYLDSYEANQTEVTWEYRGAGNIKCPFPCIKEEEYSARLNKVSNKVRYHLIKGSDAFNQAEKLCAYLPEDKRDVAYALFKSCVEATAAASIGGWPGLIACLVVQLTEYGIFCTKQGQKIEDLLIESEYHYNMAIKYYNSGQ